jgi:hypothetical protein
MEVFQESKKFPPEEKYSLTDQIDELREAWPPTLERDSKKTVSKDVRQ